MNRAAKVLIGPTARPFTIMAGAIVVLALMDRLPEKHYPGPVIRELLPNIRASPENKRRRKGGAS